MPKKSNLINSFDQKIPQDIKIVPENEQILDFICPVKKNEVLLVVVNIEGEEMGGDFTGLPLYTGRCAGALQGGGKHILVIDKNLTNVLKENLSYLKEIKVLKDDSIKMLPIDMTGEPYTFKALLREIVREQTGGGTKIIDELKKVTRILPFICSEDMKIFLEGARKLGLSNLNHICTVDAAEMVNNKGITITKKLKEKGIKVPEGIVAFSKEEAVLAYEKLQKKFGENLVFKKARSASGVGFAFVKSKQELENVLNSQLREKDYKNGIIIEERLQNIIAAPGIVIDVKPGKKKGEPEITLISISDQMFSRSVVHMGNVWPIDEKHWCEEIWDALSAYAKWVDEAGAYGVCGLDIAVCNNNDKLSVYPLDPNCRVTGSVHPALILHNIFGSARRDDIAWISDNNFEIPKDMPLKEFTEFLKINDIEFVNEKGKQEGVIVANHATNVLGKTQVIFVKKVDADLLFSEKQKIVKSMWESAKNQMQEYIKKSQDILELTKSLIKFESTQENHDAINEIFYYCMDRLKKDGIYLREYSSGFKRTLVATYTKTSHPTIFMAGHLDVVPGKKEQFKPYEMNDMLFGRGAADMKSAVAVMMEVFEYFREKPEKPSLGLMLSTDEEVGGQNGIKYLLDHKLYSCDAAIVPDSGSGLDDVIVNQKGSLHIKVRALGRAAHGSRPFEGTNAITHLLDFYYKIKELIPETLPQDFGTTISLNVIEGGKQINQVPDFASMGIDIRYPDTKEFVPVLEKIRKITKGNLEIKFNLEPYKIKEDNIWLRKYIESAEKILNKKIKPVKEYGASDASHFAKKNIPVIVTGLYKGNIHADNEWVSIKDMYSLYEILKRFIEKNAY